MRRGHWRLAGLMVVFSLAAVLSHQPASAQGTFGALPEPIRGRELDRYAERLALSEQQMLAITEHHDAYLDRFRRVRENEIEPLMERIRSMPRRFDTTVLPEIREAVRDVDRIIRRVRSVDETFFAQMQSVLTEEQAAMLPRLRLARERTLYGGEASAGMDFLNRGVRVDLSEIYFEMELDPEVAQRVDPLIAQYERRLTREARQLFEKSLTVAVEVLEEMDALGLEEEIFRNAARAMEMFQTFQEIWNEHVTEVVEEAAKLTELHRRTFRNIAPLLPEDAERAFRDRYYGQAYPEAAQIGREARRYFRAALDLEEVDDHLHDQIDALRRSHEQSQRRRADRMADYLDEQRKSVTLMQLVRQRQWTRRGDIEALREEAERADESMIQTLRGMIGEDLFARVESDAPMVQVGERASRSGFRPGRRGWGGRGDDAPLMPGAALPNRITQADLRRYAERMNLDESQIAILESLHAEYAGLFERLRDQHHAPFRESLREVQQFDRETGRLITPSPEAMSRLYQQQRSAIDAIAEADASFFDDVAVAIAESDAQRSELERIRRERVRIVYTPQQLRGESPSGDGNGEQPPQVSPWLNTEAEVDLAAIVDTLRLDGSTDSAIEEIMRDYEERAAVLFREYFRAASQVRQATAVMQLAWRQGAQAGREHSRRMGQVMRTAGSASREAARELSQINRETLDSLLERLPANAASTLRHRYQQAAFPEIFDDPTAAEPLLDAALKLPNLSDRQADQLRELAFEYRQAYGRLSQQMVDLQMTIGDPRGDRNARRWGREGSDLEVVQFDREELNDRTRRQLRSILSDEQYRHIRR